jgi:hypothetical protein
VIAKVLSPKIKFPKKLKKGGAMEVFEKLYRELRIEGRQASGLEPAEQEGIIQNVKERLKALAQEMIQKLELAGSFIQKEYERISHELQEIGGGVSATVHKRSLYLGIFYLWLTLLIIPGEFWLLSWTLKTYAQSLERFLIAFCIVVIGVVAVERYLSQIQRVQPHSFQKFTLHMIIIALIGLIASGLLLAIVRGEYLGTQNTGDSLTERVDTAIWFYATTSFMAAVMGILAITLLMVSGVTLHEGLSRTIVSGTYLSLAKKHRRLGEKLKTVALEMKEWAAVPSRGFLEFMTGLQEGKFMENANNKQKAYRESRGSFFSSPLFILIVALLLALLIVSIARADERESILLLFDTTKSSLCEDYGGNTEFRENLLFVPEVIKGLKPGTYFRVVAITDDSFGKLCFLIKGERLAIEEGIFGEKLAKAKLSLIERWKNIEIEPKADETDIFGALNVASMLLGEDSGEKKLIMLTDMRNSQRFDLESPANIEKNLVDEVEKAGLIPDLKGVKVWALGVSSCGKDMRYWISLKRFWKEFFKKSGAILQSYSIDRQWN